MEVNEEATPMLTEQETKMDASENKTLKCKPETCTCRVETRMEKPCTAIACYNFTELFACAVKCNYCVIEKAFKNHDKLVVEDIEKTKVGHDVISEILQAEDVRKKSFWNKIHNLIAKRVVDEGECVYTMCDKHENKYSDA